jgi:hypothetical protein
MLVKGLRGSPCRMRARPLSWRHLGQTVRPILAAPMFQTPALPVPGLRWSMRTIWMTPELFLDFMVAAAALGMVARLAMQRSCQAAWRG